MIDAGDRIAVTGGYGFLGWHVACRLIARHGLIPVRIGREVMSDPARLDHALSDVAGILHLAGVNRADHPDEVREGNLAAARALATALRTVGPVPVVYANSVQALNDSPYGSAKAAAAEILRSAAAGPVADVLLPNLFGEHGRADYNSFVATFAARVAADGEPTVTDDREVALLHAQDAAAVLIHALLGQVSGTVRPAGEPHLISEVLGSLREMHRIYRDGDLPALSGPFEVDLFNTYRSYRFPTMFPVLPALHADPRGGLVETVRVHGGQGQGFASGTRPGQERGNHYHLHKFERFFVLRGEAEIRLRRLLHDEVVTFHLSGDRPGFVDMPTLWTHSLVNVGDTELVTIFWSDRLLDPGQPDQYPASVLDGDDA